ncbi:MAG: TerD family protein [Planctomycetaceae bacterium]|jgi:stress response protein SCP2|nr:TerD family protein [Planctomycetaceae bacterium]
MSVSIKKSKTAEEDSLNNVKVMLSWFVRKDSVYGSFDLDISAFLLGKEDKVDCNENFIFYGNTKSLCGSVVHSGDDTSGDNDESITVHLSTLPEEVQKVLFTVTIHGGHGIGQVFGKTEAGTIYCYNADKNEEIANFDLDDAQGDRSVLFGLLIRNKNCWHWQMSGKGGHLPLKGIAVKYGVDTETVNLKKAKSESPKFHFWCQHCGAKLEAKESALGRSGTCPKCNKTIIVQHNNPPVLPPPVSLPLKPGIDIFEAIKHDNLAVVKQWITLDPNLIHTKDGNGRPLFQYATEFSSNVELLKYLVTQGANVNEKNETGSTPIHCAAAFNSNVEVLKYLISQGADVNEKNDYNTTPLHCVAFNSNIEVPQYLVSQGADVNEKDNSGWTPLHHAALSSSVVILKYLISQGADVNAQDNNRMTPLDFANTEIKKQILRNAGGTPGTITLPPQPQPGFLNLRTQLTQLANIYETQRVLHFDSHTGKVTVEITLHNTSTSRRFVTVTSTLTHPSGLKASVALNANLKPNDIKITQFNMSGFNDADLTHYHLDVKYTELNCCVITAGCGCFILFLVALICSGGCCALRTLF